MINPEDANPISALRTPPVMQVVSFTGEQHEFSCDKDMTCALPLPDNIVIAVGYAAASNVSCLNSATVPDKRSREGIPNQSVTKQPVTVINNDTTAKLKSILKKETKYPTIKKKDWSIFRVISKFIGKTYKKIKATVKAVRNSKKIPHISRKVSSHPCEIKKNSIAPSNTNVTGETNLKPCSFKVIHVTQNIIFVTPDKGTNVNASNTSTPAKNVHFAHPVVTRLRKFKRIECNDDEPCIKKREYNRERRTSVRRY